MTKICTGCRIEKPRSEFTTRRASPDGLKPRCRPCCRIEERARYYADPEKTKARIAKKYDTNREKLRQRRAAFRLANPIPPRVSNRLPDEERLARKRASRIRTYEKNREKVLATSARYREKNREKEKIDRRAHYERNREHTLRMCRQYRQTNKGKVAAWQKKYQTRKRRALPAWADLGKIMEIYQTAAWLTQESGEPWHVDHIVPLQGKTVCGLHVEINLTLLPAGENIAKSNRWWPDMFE